MKECCVSKLKGDEILARPVYLNNGEILLEAGTMLKAAYKESLVSLNISQIFIEDYFEKYESLNFYFEEKLLLKFQIELKDILSHHIYKENKGLKKIKKLALEIVEEFHKVKEKRVLDMKERASNLYEHTISMTILVLILGRSFEFTRERMESLAIGCLLHDLGHLYINTNYTDCCQNEMTPTEVFELKKHTILAYTALEKEVWIPDISKIMILSHHEKLDGSGYPLKQKNKEIECRMIQICDTFDSLVGGIECARQNILQAFQQIFDSKRYDCRMAMILERVIGRYSVGTFVKMKDGEKALIISQTEDPKAPMVLYTDEYHNNKNRIEDLRNYSENQIEGIW